MRSTSFLVFVLLIVLFTSCEKEPVDQKEKIPNIESANTGFLTEVPDTYRETGIAYRDAMHYYQKAIKEGEVQNPATDQSFMFEDIEASMKFLQAYESLGHVSNLDIEMLNTFIRYIESMNVSGTTDISEIRALVTDWITTNGISVKQYPLTFHTIMVAKEALFTNQITILREESDNLQLRGADDGFLCTVSGFLCGQTNQQVSTAARAAVIFGAGQAFKASVEWTDFQESAAVAAIGLIINTFWNVIFCNEDCDTCAPAVGIRPVFSNTTCQFLGIEAVGTFEFAERWAFLIDDNQDGAFDLTRTVLSNFVPASSLPSSTFDVIVDVDCDGATDMPWPGGTQVAATVNPNATLSPSQPTATFNQPPLNQGYYYLTNTQYCFGLSNLVTNGWTFAGWEASAGTPSSGSSTSNFCTSWNNFSFPTTTGLNAKFTHPCASSPAYLSPSSFFIVCPPGQCN